MDAIIYRLGRLLIICIQGLPLRFVARLGRFGGGVVFYFDGRHRNVAIDNLTMCFGKEKSPAEIRAIAHENFRRLGENYVCAVKTAGMSFEELKPHLEFKGFDKLPRRQADGPPPNIMAAVGHFGNFELYARIQDIRPDLQGATTYRALKQPAVNRLLQSLRGANGCLFFERRTEGDRLREVMNQRSVIIGLLVDQHSAGMRAPFLGRNCHTNLGPAVLARRYDCDIFSIICHRTGLAQWRLEVGEQVRTKTAGTVRSSVEIMAEINLLLEEAVRKDPANWFWVHRRWKN